MLARQVSAGWQVRGPPVISSLQDAAPVTVLQSDITLQLTAGDDDYYGRYMISLLTLFTDIISSTILTSFTH